MTIREYSTVNAPASYASRKQAIEGSHGRMVTYLGRCCVYYCTSLSAIAPQHVYTTYALFISSSFPSVAPDVIQSVAERIVLRARDQAVHLLLPDGSNVDLPRDTALSRSKLLRQNLQGPNSTAETSITLPSGCQECWLECLDALKPRDAQDDMYTTDESVLIANYPRLLDFFKVC